MPVARTPRSSAPVDGCGSFLPSKAHLSARPRRGFRGAALALPLLLATTWASTAHAIAAPSPDAAVPAKPEQPADASDAFRLGAIAGVGFPRPVSFEVMTKLGGYVGLGGEYGMLPQMSVKGVSVSTWAVTGDLRLFLFKGAFFFGVRAGRQHMDASASVTAAGLGSASGSVAIDTWFVNPRLGFLWTVKYGFTIGIEAGVEIPVTAAFSSSLPAVAASQIQDSSPVRFLQGSLPTVDLLRIGMLF
jgi:hypothetical protein